LIDVLIIVYFTIIRNTVIKIKYIQLFLALRQRHLTDAIEILESLGIYDDNAMLAMMRLCYGGAKK